MLKDTNPPLKARMSVALCEEPSPLHALKLTCATQRSLIGVELPVSKKNEFIELS
jgi:hypothetical protein